MTQLAMPTSGLPQPVGTMQTNVTCTTATALTIPAGANYAVISVETQNIRYTIDGSTTVTASVGHLVTTGQTISLSGNKTLANFSAIQVTSGAVFTVSYYKY
jgi:hypothetical protein